MAAHLDPRHDQSDSSVQHTSVGASGALGSLRPSSAPARTSAAAAFPSAASFVGSSFTTTGFPVRRSIPLISMGCLSSHGPADQKQPLKSKSFLWLPRTVLTCSPQSPTVQHNMELVSHFCSCRVPWHVPARGERKERHFMKSFRNDH